MNLEFLLSNSWISLMVLVLSLLTVGIFSLILENERLYSSLINNSKMISAILIGATLCLFPTLSLTLNGVLLSGTVFVEYIRWLVTAVLIVTFLFLLSKVLENSQKRTNQEPLVEIRELYIRRNFIIEPQSPLRIALTLDERNTLIDCLNDRGLSSSIDEDQFANITRLLLLAQSGEEIPAESLLYAVETAIASPICAPELPGKFLTILFKYSSRIETEYFQTLKNSILLVISANLFQMESDAANRIIDNLAAYGIQFYMEVGIYSGSPNISTLEDYERSRDFSYFFYDLQTKSKYPIHIFDSIHTFEPSMESTTFDLILSSAKLMMSTDQFYITANGSFAINF